MQTGIIDNSSSTNFERDNPKDDTDFNIVENYQIDKDDVPMNNSHVETICETIKVSKNATCKLILQLNSFIIMSI